MSKAINYLIKHENDKEEIINFVFNCSIDDIHEVVVVAPNWVNIFKDHVDELVEISEGTVFNARYKESEFTIIRTGMGAGFVGDTLLALSLTKCKKVIFVGSVGALDKNIKIGDFIIPEYSVCGEGYSRYLEPDLADCFGRKYYPHKELNHELIEVALSIVQAPRELHVGHTFSIDTILGEYINLDKVMSLNCNSIEMETSAFFKTAEYCGLEAAALLIVIDNTADDKCLFREITEEDKKVKYEGKLNVTPKIMLEFISKLSSMR